VPLGLKTLISLGKIARLLPSILGIASNTNLSGDKTAASKIVRNNILPSAAYLTAPCPFTQQLRQSSSLNLSTLPFIIK